jgi:hypothetical protein
MRDNKESQGSVALHVYILFNFGNRMYLKITKKVKTSCYILIKNTQLCQMKQ